MNASVISLGTRAHSLSRRQEAKAHGFVEPLLPLEPKDFAGRVMFWPESRLEEDVFDKALRFEGVQAIIDLRDAPALGGIRSQHHLRCHALDRWRIGYLRLGPLIAKAEKAAMMPFEVIRLVVAMLGKDERLMEALLEAPTQGAVLVIYPDDVTRLEIFLGACRALGISAFDAIPFRR